MTIMESIDAAAVRFAKRAGEVRIYQRAPDPAGDVYAELDNRVVSVTGTIRGHDFGVEIEGFPTASWNRYTRRWLESRFTDAANATPAAAPVASNAPVTIADDAVDGIVATLTAVLANLDRRLTALEGKAQP